MNFIDTVKVVRNMKKYDKLDKNIINEIVSVLESGGLIIFPTDTVYGIACDSKNDEAIRKLFSVKNRNLNKPICVLTDSINKINKICSNISELEKRMMDKYLPGDLTIVLDKKEDVSDVLTANNNTIGVRIPNNKIALEILKSFPNPLATTSVNISGKKASCKLDEFYDEFKDKVDIIIDGGITNGVSSTVIRIENGEIKILRQGSLKVEL